MRKIEKTRPVFNKETKKFDKKENVVELIPNISKCLMNKNTNHKFIHTIKHKGLTLTVKPEEVELYEEVDI